MQVHLSRYLTPFEGLPTLRQRVSNVLLSLPPDIQQDFYSDYTFEITLEKYQPGEGSQLFIRLPASGNHVSRCVVLRGKLEHAPQDFAEYVIAHELAHAYLRNGGWGEIEDPEHAADALCASWGYPKPSGRSFW